VEFVVDIVALGEIFSKYFGFPYQFHSTGAPLQGKTKTLIIFITGLHNKPQGCGASVASAAGPFTKKKKEVTCLVSFLMLICSDVVQNY
jgi:hypothetical protein